MSKNLPNDNVAFCKKISKDISAFNKVVINVQEKTVFQKRKESRRVFELSHLCCGLLCFLYIALKKGISFLPFLFYFERQTLMRNHLNY